MRLLAAVTVSLALAGAASAGTSAKSPCQLVTTTDAKAGFGMSMGAGKVMTMGLYKSCQYSKGGKSLMVLARSLSRSNFDKSAKKNPGPVVHVSGIGSDAYSVQGGTTLLLWKNGTELTLLATGVSNPLKAEKTIGKLAARRI